VVFRAWSGSRRSGPFAASRIAGSRQRSVFATQCQVGLFVWSANSCLLLLIDKTLGDVNGLSRPSRTIVFRILIETTPGPKTRCFAPARVAAQILYPNERYGLGAGPKACEGRKHALAAGPISAREACFLRWGPIGGGRWDPLGGASGSARYGGVKTRRTQCA